MMKSLFNYALREDKIDGSVRVGNVSGITFQVVPECNRHTMLLISCILAPVSKKTFQEK